MGRAGVGGRGGTPLSPSERRDAYGEDTARWGPWPGLRAYARQPARGPSKGLVAVVIENQWKTKVFGDHLGARLAHLGGYVGPSWGYVGPSWGYLDPAWGLCWPILTLCWPILGPCWPNLGTFFGLCCAMLTHLEPQSRKNARSRKHCKTR